MSLKWFLRRITRCDQSGYNNIEDKSAPAGFLDYIVEGGEACKNISNSQNAMNREARVTVRYMKICKWFLRFTSNPKLRRIIANKLALKLSKYAKTVRNNASIVRESAAIVEHNWSSVINGVTIATDDDLSAFGEFRRKILLAISIIEGMYTRIPQMALPLSSTRVRFSFPFNGLPSPNRRKRSGQRVKVGIRVFSQDSKPLDGVASTYLANPG